MGKEPAHDIADAQVRALVQDDPVIEVWADLCSARYNFARTRRALPDEEFEAAWQAGVALAAGTD